MNEKLRKILIVICLLVVSFTGYQIASSFYEIYNMKKESDKLIAEIKKNTDDESQNSEDEQGWFVPDASTYPFLKALNDDYQGWLIWDSNLISTPILQNKTDSEYYLDHNVYRNYVIGGSAFIAPETSLDAQNITMYGHSVFVTNSQTTGQMFSNLRVLEDQSAYESNKTFKIYWKDRVDSYEVYAVCETNVSTDQWSYEQSNFDNADEFNTWIGYANNHNYISPDIEAGFNDKYVTFQTCKYKEGDDRIIVIAKKIGEKNYDN